MSAIFVKMTSFRLATEEDFPTLWDIILQAKQQLKREGSDQWQKGYPMPETLLHDISRQQGFVLCHSEKIIAYGAVIFSGEPAYKHIKGAWLSDQSYVVLHRLAVADEYKRQGMAREMILQAERLAISEKVYSFRVDTHTQNKFMLKLIKSLSFVYCGKIEYEQGERLAFEKILSPHHVL